MYDNNNIFAKIIRGEIKATTLYEDDKVIAIQDIFPKAKVHALVLPKGEYIDIDDFTSNADPQEIKFFFDSLSKIAKQLGIFESGYRVLTNKGNDATQTVKHFHVHVLGGELLRAF
jgi:histidine triad (HIT) family protein